MRERIRRNRSGPTTAAMVRPREFTCSGPAGWMPPTSSGMWRKRVLERLTDPRHALALPRFDDGRCAERQQPDKGADLETRGAAVRQPQDVVVETVLLVPHAVVAHLVHGGADPQEVLRKLVGELLVAGVVGRELDRDLQHVLAVHRHPCGAVGLLEVAARGQFGAAVEDADVVEAEEASLEHALSQAVLAIHPPREVDDELIEGALEELEIPRCRASPAPCGTGRASPTHAPAG